MKFLIIYLSLILFNGCFDNKSCNCDYKALEYNWLEDIKGELALGFKPDKKHKSWYFVRSSFPSSGITILYKSLGAENVLAQDVRELNVGFIEEGGHHRDWFYYLLVIKNGKQIYITEKKEVLDFLGKIDTKEEALLLAMIEGFNIDSNNIKGSSYKKTKEGYSFLLMKDDIETPLYDEHRQYEVNVSKNGEISWKKGNIYCRGYIDCYGTD